MLPDRVSNPGPLTYESGALPIQSQTVKSADCLDTYGGCFSIRLWVQSPAV